MLETIWFIVRILLILSALIGIPAALLIRANNNRDENGNLKCPGGVLPMAGLAAYVLWTGLKK